MRPNMNRAVFAGFTGSMLIALMTWFVSPFLRGGAMDIATLLSDLLLPSWFGGAVIYLLVGGVILPALYARVLYRWLTGNPAQRGVICGLMLWLISQLVVMPVMGAGFMSARGGGLMVVIGSLLGHLVYGALLGFGTGAAHRSVSRAPAHVHPRLRLRRVG